MQRVPQPLANPEHAAKLRATPAKQIMAFKKHVSENWKRYKPTGYKAGVFFKLFYHLLFVAYFVLYGWSLSCNVFFSGCWGF